MEFAASILTAIDFCLKTSKLLHGILAGIKDGPDNVQQTATEVYGLLSTLEQIANLRVLDGPDGKLIEALKSRVLICCNDLEAFEGKLRGLTVKASDRRCGRYWKTIKTVYNEKALDKMCAIVTGHTAALHLQLGALQRYVRSSNPHIGFFCRRNC